ncbi:MAG: trypsin-like peptidase domain-containing protein [Planctomycetaceae bacterium]|nr:trypsin-like peptidase domain-containing protein [Planctomycetaceae bacterium]
MFLPGIEDLGSRIAVCLLVICAVGVAPAWGAPPQSQRETPVVKAYRAAGPAVVNISTTQLVRTRMGMLGGDIFDDIFPSPLTRQVPVQSLGSGVLIHPDGYVVTNAHVVQRAQEITVTLSDDRKFAATVLSTEPRHDLAVLKIDPKGKPLPFLPLGRSDDLMVGETVIAVGNSVGLSNTLTTGVISATNRTLSFKEGVEYAGLIQTDAPINPGNSGGPLLNIAGELIGINTAIRADAQNIGFAIAIDSLHAELPRLLDFERINRVVLGATVAPRRIEGRDTLVVTDVRTGTPAEGKLKSGDWIMAVNGKAATQMPQYACAMLQAAKDETVTFKLVRAGKDAAAAVKLQAKPRPDGAALAAKLMGVTLSPIDEALARRMRLALTSGLVVTEVEAASPAAELGLRAGDVLFQAGQLYVKDLDTLGMILEDAAPGDALRIGIVRGNMRAWATLRVRAAPTGPQKKTPKPPAAQSGETDI